MALKITEDCIACGVCEPECPVNAISPGENEGDIYIIDPNLCVECEGYYDSPKCAEVCPVDACVPA